MTKVKRCIIYIFILILIALSYVFFYTDVLTERSDINSMNLYIKQHIGLKRKEFNEFTGKGINIAIIDSGLNLHNDINKDRIIYFKDMVNNKLELYDDNGHGTFVTGVIGANGNLKGIAPDSKFIILKALDNMGQTNRETMISSLNWIYENMYIYNIKILNISIGAEAILDYKEDPLCKIVKKIYEKGVIVICSAGNNSNRDVSNELSIPGISPYALSVGSCKTNNTYDISDDEVASFSAEGKAFDLFNKPDIVTVGTNILSLDWRNNGSYVTHSGTSVSCAIVSGVAAILFEKYPNYSNNDLKNFIIKNTKKLKKSSDISQGNGELFLY